MSKKQYYEAHITMTGMAPNAMQALINGTLPGWKFSAIDGDSNLGAGVKCYLTRQMNTRIPMDKAVAHLVDVAAVVTQLGIDVLRRKIELVLWDDRISAVPCTAEECATCSSQT